MGLRRSFTSAFFVVFFAMSWSLITGCGGGGGGDDTTNIDTPGMSPSVISTTPSNGAAYVPLDSKITVTFDRAMDGGTINETTFLVSDGAVNIPGTVTYDTAANAAVFNPSSGFLVITTDYTAVVAAEVKDGEGNAMNSDYSWGFSTSIPVMTGPPVFSVESASAGETISVTVPVTGNAYKVDVYLFDPLVGLWPFYGLDSVTNVGGETTVSATVLTDPLAPGVFYPGVVVHDAFGNYTQYYYDGGYSTVSYYADQSDSTVMGDSGIVIPYVSLTPLPDLLVSVTGVVSNGSTITVSYTVYNKGVEDAGAFDVDIWPDLASPPAFGERGDGSVSYGGLAAGASLNDSIIFSGTLASGIAYAVVDTVELLAEFNEDNNIAGYWWGGTKYSSSDIPKPINDSATTESVLTVSGLSAPIAHIRVYVDITHTYDNDLDIFLISPAGTTVELSTDNGGIGDNYTNTAFEDDASISIIDGTPPFTGTFRPEGSLSVLNGEAADGVWTLSVFDDAVGDQGALNAWGIEIR